MKWLRLMQPAKHIMRHIFMPIFCLYSSSQDLLDSCHDHPSYGNAEYFKIPASRHGLPGLAIASMRSDQGRRQKSARDERKGEPFLPCDLMSRRMQSSEGSRSLREGAVLTAHARRDTITDSAGGGCKVIADEVIERMAPLDSRFGAGPVRPCVGGGMFRIASNKGLPRIDENRRTLQRLSPCKSQASKQGAPHSKYWSLL